MQAEVAELANKGTPNGMRLFCVHDDQFLVDLLRYALERKGFALQTPMVCYADTAR